MQEVRPWCFSGIDESNNGRPKEIHVCTFSNFPNDNLIYVEPVFPKLRKIKKGIRNPSLIARNGKREYVFLEYETFKYKNIPRYKKRGIIIASLLYKENLCPGLSIFIDGELSQREQDALNSIVKEATGLEKFNIVDGNDLDRRMELVNISDQLAYWIYSRKPRDWIENSKRRKQLLMGI